VEVDGFAPRSVVGVSETGSKFGEVVAYRTEVVVDHVHDDCETVLMAGVHKLLQAGWTTVRRLRRIETGAVVSPVPVSGKLGDRHDFNRGNAKIAKVGEVRYDARE